MSVSTSPCLPAEIWAVLQLSSSYFDLCFVGNIPVHTSQPSKPVCDTRGEKSGPQHSSGPPEASPGVGKSCRNAGQHPANSMGSHRAPVPSTWPVTSPVPSPCCALSPFLHLPVLVQPLSPSLAAPILNFISTAAA